MALRMTRSEAGFTYIVALVMVVIMGIMLGAIGQSVKVIMQREREKELIFRGLQYRDALELWSKKNPNNLLKAETIKNLEDKLVAGGDKLGKEFYLRKIYKDPITGSDFVLVKDKVTQEIQGVKSTSSEEPFKQGDFPEVIKSFEGKKKYSEWEFVFKKGLKTPAGSAAPGSAVIKPFPLSTPESP